MLLPTRRPRFRKPAKIKLPVRETFRHQVLFDHAPDAILVSDRSGSIVQANAQAEAMFHYGRHELLGRPIELLIPERLRDAHIRHRAEFYTRPHTRPIGAAMNLKARRKDGSEIPVEISLSPYRHRGKFLIIAIIRDVTERRKMEEALRERFEQLQSLHEITLIILNSDSLDHVLSKILERIFAVLGFDIGVIRLFNPETKMLEEAMSRGYRSSERNRPLSTNIDSPLVGHMQTSVFRAQGAYVTEDIVREPGFRTFKREGVRSAVVVPVRIEEKMLGTMQLGCRTLRRFAPEQIGFLETVGQQLGIAVQKIRLQEEIVKRADQLTVKTLELERANQAKDEFLNIVSHELKTPLNVVMGYTDLLRDGILGETTPAQIDALTTMACRADDLLKVISDILRVVQLNSGNIHTRVSSVNLNDLVEEIRLRCKISSDEGRAVIWSIPPALPTVETDPEMLMEIFQNLLHNAAKFTEKGWIKIALRHLPKRNLVRLTVADTGVGISKEVAPVIFDKFRQGDSSATRFHGGVGLGLYIVKVLAQLLNYKIKLKSQIGRGSVFQVAIPC